MWTWTRLVNNNRHMQAGEGNWYSLETQSNIFFPTWRCLYRDAAGSRRLCNPRPPFQRPTPQCVGEHLAGSDARTGELSAGQLYYGAASIMAIPGKTCQMFSGLSGSKWLGRNSDDPPPWGSCGGELGEESGESSSPGWIVT